MAHWTEEYFVDNPELQMMSFRWLLEKTPGEVDFLIARLEENGFKQGRILDMNCGIGRHSVELAGRGISVLGTDISPLYVKVAGERAREAGVGDKASFRVVDMRQIASRLSGEEPFDGVISMQTAMGYYDDATEEDIVRQCGILVKPGGFFALDIVNRDYLLQHYSRTSHASIEGYRLLEEHKFDVWKSRNVNTWTYLKKMDDDNYQEVKSITLDHRLWSPHELITLFEKAGFTYKGIYNGFSDTIPYIARELTSTNTLEFMNCFHLLYIFGKS
jgi:2-polyprenyl-3-methyl-5-hydroxy-6-metoxy-1,4-benzoquinol methylase